MNAMLSLLDYAAKFILIFTVGLLLADGITHLIISLGGAA